MARRLPASTRILIATSPLFAPTMAAGAFAVAYQNALGLTPTQIGTLAGAAAALAPIFLLFGSFGAERWGRVNAMTLFDVTGWVVPSLLLAAATAPLHVAFALLLAATAQGSQSGFQGLLVARVPPAQRARAFATLHLVLGASLALLPAVGALIVARWGLVPALRILYLAAAGGVATMVVSRYLLLTRSRRGPRPARREGPPPRTLAQTAHVIRRAHLGPILLGTMFLALGTGLAILGPIRIIHHIGLDPWWLGVLAAVATASSLFAHSLASRLSLPPKSWAVAGALLGLAATALFLAARDPGLFIVSALVGGFAGAWTLIGADSLLHNAVSERWRDRAVAIHLAARYGGTILGPIAGGALYSANPDLPWMAALPFFAIGALLWASTSGGNLTRSRPVPAAVP